MLRMGNLDLIDSVDPYCERESGGDTPLCRLAVLGAIGKEGEIIARLPYSETLHRLSK